MFKIQFSTCFLITSPAELLCHYCSYKKTPKAGGYILRTFYFRTDSFTSFLSNGSGTVVANYNIVDI